MLAADVEFGVLGILEGPEADEAFAELVFIGAIDVVLTVPDSNEVRIGNVDVDAGDLTAFGKVINLKGEQGLDRYCALLLIFLVDFDFFFLLLFLLAAKGVLLLSILFFIIQTLGLLNVYLWVSFIKHVLLMELRLRQQPFNDPNRRQNRWRQLNIHVLDFS